MTGSHPELKLQVGGTVNPRTAVYIVRPTDDELLKLLERGDYANVLCSRQMGKSSLLVRTKSRLLARGYAVAAMDVAGYLGTPRDADEWYQGLLDAIANQLSITVDVPLWWRSSRAITPNQKLIQFFRDEIASKSTKNVVIFLDEIESTLRLPYADDFFVAIRAMYNDRAAEELYERITFCLVGVASPNELIKEPRTTPYNIGRTLALEDFDPDRDNLEALYRAIAPDPAVGEKAVRSVLKWTDGHPYLTLRVCDNLLVSGNTSDEQIESLVQSQFTSLDHLHADIHFQQVLRFLAERVDDRMAALALYQELCEGSRVRDHATPAHIALKLTGLVKRDSSGYLTIRNRIYSRVFSLSWASKALESDVDAFEKLLDLLGPDRDSAGEEYQRLHRDLVRIFTWNGVSSPEDSADETLDRVAEQLDKGAEISNLSLYCYAMANRILRQQRRRPNTKVNIEDVLLVYKSPQEGKLEDLQRECLSQCLQRLSPDHQDMILRYYSGERRSKIQNRKALATELKLPVNALRVRVFRIRQALEKCMERCIAMQGMQ